MPDYTVITRLDRDGMHSYLAAIPGRVEVCALESAYDGAHAAHVAAPTADDALNTAIAAFRTVGPTNVRPNCADPVHGTRWTVIGLIDRHDPSYPSLHAAVPGVHDVQGRWDSMVEDRWTVVVDADSPHDAAVAARVVARRQHRDTYADY